MLFIVWVLLGTSIAFLFYMNRPLEHEHDPTSIADRIQGAKRHGYLRDFVYGAIDGTVTTFAVVTSVAGAGLNPEVVIVLGMANLLGDGFSMAASNFLGTRTEQQLREKARAMEKRHIQLVPEGEREEIRQIFASKGFEGSDLERAIEIVTSCERRWVDTMLVEELGISLEGPSAYRAAATTFFAFCIVGLLPLLAFVCGWFGPSESHWAYLLSTFMTAVAFFGVGTAKSYFVDQKWYWSGLETLSVGSLAALLAYIVSSLLKGIVG